MNKEAREVLDNLCLAIAEAELSDEQWNVVSDRYNRAMNLLNGVDKCENCLVEGGGHMGWCIEGEPKKVVYLYGEIT